MACRLILAPPCRILQVFDGHGGTTAAQFAKENMLDLLVEQPTFPDSPFAALVRNSAIYGLCFEAHRESYQMYHLQRGGRNASHSPLLTNVLPILFGVTSCRKDSMRVGYGGFSVGDGLQASVDTKPSFSLQWNLGSGALVTVHGRSFNHLTSHQGVLQF